MRFADFFAGIGLASLGLERAGWTCVFANDNDQRKHEMYAANFPADHYVVEDVQKVTAAEVPEVDLAWASFPCTDLSLAGERHGLDGHSMVKVQSVPNVRRKSLLPEVRKHIAPGAEVFTDALPSYNGLEADYIHKVVDHAESYGEGKVHTNGLENFWSLLKRGIKGTYVSIEPFTCSVTWTKRRFGSTVVRLETPPVL